MNDSTVPLWEANVPQQLGREHKPSLFPGVQWPVRPSSLNLPDRRRAWVMAFSTSHGEDRHDRKIGWHLVSPKYSDLKYLREGRESAWHRSLSNQYLMTALVVILLTSDLEGLVWSQEDGWGSSYWRHNCLILQNQDLEDNDGEDITFLACIAKMLFPSLSLHNCPNKENLLRWSWSVRGR